MPSPRGTVLSCHDLPEAELCAARLDGELFRVDECFAPIDQVELPAHRALALASLLPDRLIAEQHSAAWVMGVLDRAPERHEFCVASGARARPANPRRLSIREVVIAPGDIIEYPGLRVTTPLRTAMDLVRSSSFDDGDQQLVLDILELAGSDVAECTERFMLKRNLPGKQRSLHRMELLAARAVAQPLLTR